MPELPEVETVRRGLERLLSDRTIVAVDFNWAKSFPNSQSDIDNFLIGASVVSVRRRAKVLMIDLSTNYSLVVHLKMTGQLVFVGGIDQNGVEERVIGNGVEDASQDREEAIRDSVSLHITQPPIPNGAERWGAGHPNDSLVGKLPDKSTRVTITFHDGSKLFFNDQRKFGWMRLLPTAEIQNIDFMKRVGPEPLNADFTSEVFINRVMRRKNSTIKAAILDQTVLAGVGNIYADESLFAAQIHPASMVSAIPKSRLAKLRKEIRDVLQLSIDKGGSTNRNYVNAEGKRGSYMDFAKVFRRENMPCPVCGSEITKIRVAGRGTHVCTKCQKLYRGSK